jgi:hypothetical protein
VLRHALRASSSVLKWFCLSQDGAAPPPLSFPSLSPCPPLVLVLAVLANETLNRIVPKAAGTHKAHVLSIPL